MCFYFHHLVFECIPFLCAALDGEIAGEWVTGAPTQQWGNHWRTLGVKGGLWWRWCLGSCLGIPQTVSRSACTSGGPCAHTNCALQTDLIKMFTCRISPERPEMDVRLEVTEREDWENNSSNVHVEVLGLTRTRSSFCLLSSITCWLNGELPTSG